jgi:hypothetical protein
MANTVRAPTRNEQLPLSPKHIEATRTPRCSAEDDPRSKQGAARQQYVEDHVEATNPETDVRRRLNPTAREKPTTLAQSPFLIAAGYGSLCSQWRSEPGIGGLGSTRILLPPGPHFESCRARGCLHDRLPGAVRSAAPLRTPCTQVRAIQYPRRRKDWDLKLDFILSLDDALRTKSRMEGAASFAS